MVDLTASANKWCFEGTTGKGFSADAAQPACAKSDGSADESAACSCGTTDIIKVAANKVCKVTSNVASEKNKKCAKSDGSAAESAACSCGNNCQAVASGKVCRVESAVGYEVAKVKCSKVDGSANVTADCTCGYQTTMVDLTASANKWCFEGTTGKGFSADAAQPACAK